MATHIPLQLDTGDNTVRRVPTGDTLTPASMGVAVAVVGTTDVQTLTNKTLTAPQVDTLNCTAAEDTPVLGLAVVGGSPGVNYLQVTSAPASLSPVIEPVGADAVINMRIRSKGVGSNVTVNNVPVVVTTGAQTLVSKTLTAPVIGDFTNANHTHTGAASGGLLTNAAFAPGQGVTRLLFAPIVSSTAIHTTASETAFDNVAYPTTLNVLLGQVGQAIRVTFAGSFGITGTPTIRFRLRGTAGIGTLWDSGAITTAVAGNFCGSVILVARDVTASGVVFGTVPSLLSVGTVHTVVTANSTAFDFVTLGGTATNLELSVEWSASSASNTVTLQAFGLEALN